MIRLIPVDNALRRHAARLRPLGLAIAIPALLAGCVLPANVPPPDAVAPDQYRAGDDQPSVWPSATWWQNFDSPELDRLMGQARRANYDIAAAAARVAQADAQIRVSGASLLPSLNAQGTASRNYQAGSDRSNSISLPNGNGGTTTTTLGSGGSTASNNYQATLSASYELDFWGQNLSNLKSAKQAALASRYDAATVALSTEASVASTYFTIVATQDRLKIAQDNLATARDLLKALQAQLQVGIANALDVAQQETQVANQQAAIPPLRQQLQQNINALAVLLGQPPAALNIRIADPSALTVPTIAAGLPATLLTRRPDIAQARAQLAGARYDVSSAKAALFPSFDLTAQGGWQNALLGGLFDPVNEFYSLAGNITQPIFQGGALRGQLAVSRARYAELLADYQSTVINAFEDVDNALTDVRQTTEQEKRQAHAVALAQRALDISRARLREGITDVTTVLDTEQTLFSARDTLAQTRQARLNAAVSLYQALGGGWDEDDIDTAQMPAL
ncbi:efflux transporter outer membrane subunit [Salinisphaera sp. Q1T1-3]|uniref:efflux transporter outer membrane subunit n=1 Tax=Salinisphaera sp. Q1T1-3 TaxID=2321229 RepID=UPI000E72CE79|nr:efflux transporter outer membrane subunit [Salinisphaera sp. Q1T1-3]RJS94293.1 efflux transporter outer membrane subunit [Salinisphaera sp. Q1T1-3]